MKIRGNKAYDHIKKFVQLELIRKKRMGHTNEISLSDDFYDYFNVEDTGKGVFNSGRGENEKSEEINDKRDDIGEV